MKKNSIIPLFIILLILNSCGIVQSMMPNHYPDFEQYTFEKVRDYGEIETWIRENTDYRIIGEVTYEPLSYPIYEITIDNGADKEVFVFGGIHGTQPGGTFSCLYMAEELMINNNLKKYNYKIVPVINPWGYEHNVRYNKEGYEINMDFSNMNCFTQEAKIILETYGDQQPYLVIDNQEHFNQPDNYFFVYNRQTENKLRPFIENNPQYRYSDNMKFHIYKSDHGIVRINKGILSLIKASDRWALSNSFMQVTDNVVVIESGMRLNSMEQRIQFHLDAMEYMIVNF